MNEVHWSDPEFQEWEAQQLGEYKQITLTRDIYGKEPVVFYSHDYPKGHWMRPNINGFYRNPMISLKDDEFDNTATANTARSERRIEEAQPTSLNEDSSFSSSNGDSE